MLTGTATVAVTRDILSNYQVSVTTVCTLFVDFSVMSHSSHTATVVFVASLIILSS